MATAKESLEMMRAIGELTKGFQEATPMLYRTLERMMSAVSGRDAFGYIQAMDIVDKASVDEKDAMLLLITQWVATVLHATGSDHLLKDILLELFPDSKMLKLTPGCKITEL